MDPMGQRRDRIGDALGDQQVVHRGQPLQPQNADGVGDVVERGSGDRPGGKRVQVDPVPERQSGPVEVARVDAIPRSEAPDQHAGQHEQHQTVDPEEATEVEGAGGAADMGVGLLGNTGIDTLQGRCRIGRRKNGVGHHEGDREGPVSPIEGFHYPSPVARNQETLPKNFSAPWGLSATGGNFSRRGSCGSRSPAPPGRGCAR